MWDLLIWKNFVEITGGFICGVYFLGQRAFCNTPIEGLRLCSATQKKHFEKIGISLDKYYWRLIKKKWKKKNTPGCQNKKYK